MIDMGPGRILFLDPGTRNTGFAFWDDFDPIGKAVPPDITGVQRAKSKIPWEEAVGIICTWFYKFVTSMNVECVGIEFPQLWVGSSLSLLSASKGDLFKLTYLVGGLGEVARCNCDRAPVLITPMEWKGQMGKDVVDRRIKLAIGHEYKNHESDAVGIGLAAQEKL